MKKPVNTEDIKAVDFSGAVRGKHAAAYRRGHTVKVHHEDGSILVQRFVPDKDAVVLDKDVKAYFPDATAVNDALRALINILPHGRKRVAAGH